MDKRLLTRTQLEKRKSNLYYRKAVSFLCNKIFNEKLSNIYYKKFINDKIFNVGGITVIKPINPEYE